MLNASQTVTALGRAKIVIQNKECPRYYDRRQWEEYKRWLDEAYNFAVEETKKQKTLLRL